MKTLRTPLARWFVLVLLAGTGLGCSSGTEIEVKDPGKVEVPPPPKQVDPSKLGSKPPKGGGSSQDPRELTKLPPGQ